MEDMENWILQAAKASMATITSATTAIIAPEAGAHETDDAAAVAFLTSPFHSRSVRTIIIITYNLLPEDGCFLKYYNKELCSRVNEWGVDGLLFILKHDVSCLHILESLASVPSCTALCITHGTLTSTSPMTVTTALGRAISCSPNLTHLYLRSSSSNFDAQQLLGEALFQSCTGSLQSLSIEASLCSETSLIPILASSTCSLKSLSITSSNDSFLKSSWSLDLIRNICSKLAANTIDLQSLSLIHYFSNGLNDFSHAVVTRKVWFMLGTMLAYNTSLTSFTLHDFCLQEAAVCCLFTSLEKNRYLTYLSLAHCRAQCRLESSSNWPNASVLGSLRVNTALHEVDLTGTPLENDNAIKVELSRKKADIEPMEVLASRQCVRVLPATVRLFFCGLQYSGKTTLSKSLANWNKKTFWLTRLKQTRGIEVYESI